MIKIFSILLLTCVLTSCGMMQQNCTSLLDDRVAYRDCRATQGDQAAQFELGMEAFDAENYDVAISWLKRAARPRATQGPLYLEPDPNRRRDLAYEEDMRPQLPGHSGAQRLLLRIYEEGIGVSPDPEQAEHYRNLINQ